MSSTLIRKSLLSPARRQGRASGHIFHGAGPECVLPCGGCGLGSMKWPALARGTSMGTATQCSNTGSQNDVAMAAYLGAPNREQQQQYNWIAGTLCLQSCGSQDRRGASTCESSVGQRRRVYCRHRRSTINRAAHMAGRRLTPGFLQSIRPTCLHYLLLMLAWPSRAMHMPVLQCTAEAAAKAGSNAHRRKARLCWARHRSPSRTSGRQSHTGGNAHKPKANSAAYFVLPHHEGNTRSWKLSDILLFALLGAAAIGVPHMKY